MNPKYGLSLKQPWLNIIKYGVKTIETRVWHTHYRGDLLLCASKSPQTWWTVNTIVTPVQYRHIRELESYCRSKHNISSFLQPSDGRAYVVARLVDCRVMVRNDESGACVEYDRTLYSWVLDDIRIIEPVELTPKKSRMKLFPLTDQDRSMLRLAS